MVFNEKASNIQKFVKVYFVRTAFVEVLFVGTTFVSSLISSHVVTKSSIILPTYLPYLQLNIDINIDTNIDFVARAIFFFFYTHTFTHWYSIFDLSYIFYYQTNIHIYMTYVLLMFLIRLFLLSY